MKNNITFDGIINLFTEKTNFTIIAHRRPDGDAVGSAAGLCLALRHLGKTAHWTSSDPVPPSLEFVPGVEHFTCTPNPNAFVVTVDTATPSMFDKLPSELHRIDLKIDHHASGEDYATYNYTDTTAAACSEIIFRLAQQSNALTDDVCRAIYVGLIADTGCFRYANTTANSFAIATEIACRGIAVAPIAEACFGTRTPAATAALAHALNTAVYMGDAAICAFTAADKARLGMTDNDTSEISPFLRETQGVNFSAVLTQASDDLTEFRLSTRSREKYDASAFCRLFGGGGHIRAAGATITANSPDAAWEQLTAAVKTFVGER
ncbi:MAG: DHH family phosphoesterase [Oscillospiraceae bacterium]|nr:DHH family phosphoesterase [Oscillospiraceae bacterium]